MSVTDLQRARTELGLQENGDPPELEGRSIEERAEDGEEQGELFPVGSVEGDSKVSHKNLIKPGMSVTTEAAISRAAVPLRSGLFAFGQQGEALVRYEAGVVHQKPQFGEEQANGLKKVDGVKLVQELRAIHVQDAGKLYTRPQVVEMLEELGASSEQITDLLGEE